MNRRRAWLLALALVALLGGRADAEIIAQRTQLQSITTSGSDCSTATSCVVLTDVFRTIGIGVQLAGTFTGTVQFEGTMDGTNWTAHSMVPLAAGVAVTSATATGAWVASTCTTTSACSQGAVLQGFRVRASALASGTVTVSIIAR